MGTKEIIPVTFKDTTLPIVRDDPMLTAGSILLHDVGHSRGGLGVADNVVPPNDTPVPNIAWREAAAAMGIAGATKDTLNSIFKQSGYGTAAGIIERTSKKGVHSVTAKAAGSTPAGAASIDLNTAVRDFIWNNTNLNAAAGPAHIFWISVWYRVTRGAVTGIGNGRSIGIEITSNATPAQNYLVLQDIPASSTVTSVPTATRTASNGYWNGTRPSAANTISHLMALGGADAYSYSSDIRRAQADLVWYRSYIEDLTISGRTAAQCLALDTELLAAATAPGGRFHDDVLPTNPASIP